MLKAHRTLLGFAAVALGAFLLSASAFLLGAFDTWQEKLTDRLFLAEAPSEDIVIVAIDNASLHAIGQWPWRRSVFADLVEKLQLAQAIGIDVNFAEPSRFSSADDRMLAQAIAQSAPPVVLPIQIERGTVVSAPTEALAGVGEQGVSNVVADADSVVRDVLIKQNELPSFAAALTKRDIAALPELARLDYAGPAGTFHRFAATDVLEGAVPPRVFKDATVLVGATAQDLQDFVQTPFGEMPGVEYHANATRFLMRGAFFTELSPQGSVALMALIAGLAAFAVYTLRRLMLLTAALALLFAALTGAVFAAFSFHVVLPGLYFGLVFFTTAGAAILFQYVTESKQKQFIRKTFQYYLASDALDELLKHPEKLKLGGEARNVTILFSDIRGFTSVSETLSPEELTNVMNDYLSAMTDVIMERRGVIDKYIGDAIMAFWGAPAENEAHPEDACRAVVEMAGALTELNERFKQEGKPPLSIGVGLNTGEVVVGNMGSAKRFDYTIMGDEVNFASRLEGLTKQYGAMCLVSESTYKAAAGGGIHFRKLDRVTVKGKSEPRRIYELITEPMTAARRDALARFSDGLAAYEAGEFNTAAAAFEKALSAADDAPSGVFLERSRALAADPPEEWDGVYTFTEK